MIWLPDTLPEGRKLYFASDFHLGANGAGPQQSSRNREDRIVRWLNAIQPDAAAVFLMGDIFDFWFEYRHVIPKGFIRLQGKLAQLTDSGIPVAFFTGNHDMWMFGYFTEELGIPVYRQPQTFTINQKTFLIGHGDGLGPGDRVYKVLKRIFANKFFQQLFGALHPAVGMGIAQGWSSRSRLHNNKREGHIITESEWLYTYCKQQEALMHHDYYIFGHRHLPLDLPVGPSSRYLNLGEWINHYTYAEFNGTDLLLKTFESEGNPPT